jgi:hypothetical protein
MVQGSPGKALDVIIAKNHQISSLRRSHLVLPVQQDLERAAWCFLASDSLDITIESRPEERSICHKKLLQGCFNWEMVEEGRCWRSHEAGMAKKAGMLCVLRSHL